jgi:hypothetical protein
MREIIIWVLAQNFLQLLLNRFQVRDQNRRRGEDFDLPLGAAGGCFVFFVCPGLAFSYFLFFNALDVDRRACCLSGFRVLLLCRGFTFSKVTNSHLNHAA